MLPQFSCLVVYNSTPFCSTPFLSCQPFRTTRPTRPYLAFTPNERTHTEGKARKLHVNFMSEHQPEEEGHVVDDLPLLVPPSKPTGIVVRDDDEVDAVFEVVDEDDEEECDTEGLERQPQPAAASSASQQSTSGADATQPMSMQASDDGQMLRASSRTNRRDIRGAPVTWLLPLPRSRSSTSSTPPPSVAVAVVATATLGSAAADSTAAAPASHDIDEPVPFVDRSSSSSPLTAVQPEATVDRIGAYFGYNGVDGMVPKPAYDAAIQRIKTLEGNLGSANRDIRSHTSTISELQSQIQQLQQQVAHKESMIRQMMEMESALSERERELDAREDALTQLAKQQRRITRKGGIQGIDALPITGVAPVDAVGASGTGRRRIGVDRREEEAYASWVGGLASNAALRFPSHVVTRGSLSGSQVTMEPTSMVARSIQLLHQVGHSHTPGGHLPPRSQSSLGV